MRSKSQQEAFQYHSHAAKVTAVERSDRQLNNACYIATAHARNLGFARTSAVARRANFASLFRLVRQRSVSFGQDRWLARKGSIPGASTSLRHNAAL